MSRKSPYRHTVKEHTRRNGKGNLKPVREYERGKGEKEKKKNRRSKVVEGKYESYVVDITYPDGTFETFDLTAPGYSSALNKGIMQRESYDVPYIIKMRGR